MTPTVRSGERVRVHATPRIRSGDVVLFETTGGDDLVLHRVVFAPFWSSWFVHVGDAGQLAGISRRERVIGRADLPARLPSLRALWKGSARLYAAARSRGRRSRR